MTFHPTLGVQHLELSRLLASFRGRQPLGLSGACSFSAPLSDLLHRQGQGGAPYGRWTMRTLEQVETVVQVLLDDVKAFGAPFLHSFDSIEDLIVRLEHAPRYQELRAHLAIACALTGRRAQAANVLGEYMEKVTCQRPPMLDQSRLFIESFVSHFRLAASLQDLPSGA
ncbi:hypothetical protein GXW82_04570 [Streptacidiphilus sp. 4-A2]|nr:hypothetical protein [Streptacidiphilus sp. 4-A2]